MKTKQIRKEFIPKDPVLDLSDIVKVKSYKFNNVYDNKTLLFIINKNNKLSLTMDDVAFDEFDEKHAIIRAKNKEKYRGKVQVNYSEAKNKGFIIWLIISIAIMFLALSVLLPMGLIGNSSDSWYDAGTAVLISSAPIAGVAFISIIICVLKWRGEITPKKLKSVEGKSQTKEKEE